MLFQSERSIFLAFVSLFKAKYVRFLKTNKQTNDKKTEISTVLENSNAIQKLLETDKEASGRYFLVVPSFLSMLIGANKEYLLSYNVHYEIARHLHLERPLAKE